MTPRDFAGLWLALLILGMVAAVAYRSVDAAGTTLDWVDRTHRTLEELGEVNGAYGRASAARRAFIVAGDASQLPDIGDLDGHVDHVLRSVREAFAQSPIQSQRLDTLADLIHDRLRALDLAVSKRRTVGAASETPEGLALTARIRATREEIEAEENRLLNERAELTRRDLHRTKVAEVVGTLTSFLLLLFGFRQLAREVGRRRKSEQALRASESFLDSIVENIPDMVFVKEAGSLRFERINRAGEELLGVARRDVIAKRDEDIFPPEQAAIFLAHDRDTLEKKVAVDVLEDAVPTAHGPRWLRTRKVPVLNEEGEPRFLLGIAEDVTERRKTEAALKEAKDAAERANKELEAFSYSVAHDLRAPLRGIQGFSLALEEDSGHRLDDTGIAHLHRVRAAAEHMGRLIDGLLGLARLTRGEVLRETLNLTELAQNGVARLREANPEKNVEAVIEEGLTASGDARLVVAVLDNLLGNAWKFTSKVAVARVDVGRARAFGASTFFVRDNGAGFDQAYAHKLFGAFQRLHAVTDFDGSGIGLATVQRIIRRHGGQVWAEGAVNAGATFYFTLESPS